MLTLKKKYADYFLNYHMRYMNKSNYNVKTYCSLCIMFQENINNNYCNKDRKSYNSVRRPLNVFFSGFLHKNFAI